MPAPDLLPQSILPGAQKRLDALDPPGVVQMQLGITVPDKQVFPLAALRLDRGGTPDVPGLLIPFRVCYPVLRPGAEQGDGAVPALLVCAPPAGESITVIPI